MNIQLNSSTQKILIHSEKELHDFWKQALQQIHSKKCLILLDGEVGAGKTTSVQAICQILSLDAAASPSFAISHSYKSSSGFVLEHSDLYRLESEEDLDSTGFWDIFSKEAWVIVEWADRVSDESWPLGWPILRVKIQIPDKSESSSHSLRQIQFQFT